MSDFTSVWLSTPLRALHPRDDMKPSADGFEAREMTLHILRAEVPYSTSETELAEIRMAMRRVLQVGLQTSVETTRDPSNRRIILTAVTSLEVP